MDPPPTHLLYPAQHYLYSHPQPAPAAAPAAQNYVYSQPTPSSADPAQHYLYSHPPPSAAQHYLYSQPPPSTADPAQNYLYSQPPTSAAQHYLYSHPPPSTAAALNNVYSHPQPSVSAPVLCTPMSPYRTQNPPPYSLPSTTIPYQPYADNSAAYQPHSSSVDVRFGQSHAIINTNPPIRNPNDDYLRRIRNEVIFLHALWDQGPPDSGNNHHFTNHHLKPSPTTVFKKTKKPTRSVPITDNPWPVPPESPAPPDSESGWPELTSRPTPPAPVSSKEDIATVSPAKVQRKALDSFRIFFRGKHGPESDCESDGDDDEEDQDELSAKLDKFWEVFEGDQELRDYYVKNWGNGEFLCLVCGGSGQKNGRKYKNSLALVQHTLTVSNTKKKHAHRAYGQVICKVLGWDINQLPLVSRNFCLQQGNGMSSAEACKDDPVVGETSIAPLVNGNEQMDPSEATFNSEEDISAEKKETSELSMILDNPGGQQGNGMRSAEACKDDHVVVETSIAALVNGNEQSDPSKATSALGEDISAEKKETSDLSLMLDNPGGEQISTVNSAGTSKNHPDISEEKTDASLNEHVLYDPPCAVGDAADGNDAEKNETSILPCIVMGSQGEAQIHIRSISVHEPATQI